VSSLGNYGEKITAEFYNQGTSGTSRIQSLFGMLKDPIVFSETKTLYCIITSSISTTGSVHLSKAKSWGQETNPLIGEIKVKEGTHCYKIKFNKQFSDEYYLTPSDFYYVLFEFSSVTPFDNLVFDAYFFDNENLYNILISFDLSKYYTKSEIDSLIENSSYDYKIIFWGDSLTAGAGGNGTTYPKVCADELGITSYLNAGVGGETANTIASRNGANNMIIPIGDVNGTYSIGDLKDAYGTNILPLRQGTGGNTVNPILVNGHKCTLSLSQTSSTDANATYTITGYTGEPTKYPMPCKFSGCNLTADITVIFVGQNGPSFEQRLSIIDSIVSRTNGKYIVLTLSSGTEEQMKSQEATMLSKYGNHLFKTREMLSKYGLSMMNMTPTDEDTTAISNGSVPPSLRADSVHLNSSGYTALGKMLATHIRALGYVN
jgi:lysophospholipase L1-like esterase